MSRYPLIRTIYLYLFALIGLALITIGAVRFVNMGLKIFVFTQAEQDQYMRYPELPMPYAVSPLEKAKEDKELSEEERAQVKTYLEEYKKWKEQRDKIDYRLVERHRDASMNIALIIVGLPLYLYHWRTIQKETKDTTNS
ncbi:hypothetical protein HY622_02200 [Candidatus Uhrbacteria bacterium]|nr:hypothetical protein [Candidatus Uhrbacteria bacterium]